MSARHNQRRASALTLLIALALLMQNALPARAQTMNAMTAKSTANDKLTYPAAARGEQTDNYHGTTVADPFRWLEDLDSAETKAWVTAENELTQNYLQRIPARGALKARLTKLWNYERYGVPFKEGGRYFYSKNDGLQNQSVFYTVKNLAEQPTLLLDSNKLSTDGTVALSGMSISDNGDLMAYSLSASGSDWQEWRIRDVATGKDYPEVLKWVKFSGASWTPDNQGFFYNRYPEPKSDGNAALMSVNYYQKLYYHKLGTPQSEDKLIYEDNDHKDWFFGGSVTEDGNYLIINVGQGTDPKNRVYFKDLKKADAPVVKLLDAFDASYNFVGNDGATFYFVTDKNAPRGRVIAIDTANPASDKWRELVAQNDATLQGANLLDEMFVLTYLKDAQTKVTIHKLDGKLVREVKLPGIGTASGFGGKRKDTETFYAFTSFTTPTAIYRYDVKADKSVVFRQPKVDFNSNDYVTQQVFFKSKDGTRVPMFIVHKKGLKMDGTNPTYLYGYGGFNISLTPAFSVTNLVWMEMGGIYAQANLRGGGEYGEDWHLAGTKLRKQNVFDDFIGAAEWLIKEKYTSTPKLAIGGGSNGGLLVGAALTQRPELFGAALPAVGVMDMLRFQKFTIGWAWTSDYGSSDNADEFKALYAYSPLHNIKPGVKYPATMVTTADHDDRVWPGHSFKFAATLQAAQAGDAPVLIRIETKAGHGAGKPTTKIIEEAADKWGFLVRELKMSPDFTLSGE